MRLPHRIWLAAGLVAALIFGGCAPRPPIPPASSTASRAVPASLRAKRHWTPADEREMTARFRRLRAELPKLARQAPGRAAAIWVEDRLRNRRFAVNGDWLFHSASMIKLAIAGAAYEYWQRHPERRTAELERRVWRMIAESHNASTDVVVDQIGGLRRVNDYARRHGLRGTRMVRKMLAWRGSTAFNVTTPRDVAASLRAVDSGNFVDRAASAAIWKALRDQVLVQRIPAGLPSGQHLQVGNKTGTNPVALHDGAVVRGEGLRYLLVIMVDHPRSEEAGDAYCRRVSARIYRALAP